MDEHQISSLINHGILKKTFPGAVALIVEDNNVLYHKAFGNRMVRPKILPMETDTIFDLASLTKPIVISTLIMKLVEIVRGNYTSDATSRKYNIIGSVS